MTSDPIADLSHLDDIERELADVARSLERLDDGSYGTCEVCGVALPDELLAASPTRRTCPEHTID